MIIDAGNTAVETINSLLDTPNVRNSIKTYKNRTGKIIQFPSRKVFEQDIAQTNMEALEADKITADFTSQTYLHLLLVAGSRTLHRTRLLHGK